MRPYKMYKIKLYIIVYFLYFRIGYLFSHLLMFFRFFKYRRIGKILLQNFFWTPVNRALYSKKFRNL